MKFSNRNEIDAQQFIYGRISSRFRFFSSSVRRANNEPFRAVKTQTRTPNLFSPQQNRSRISAARLVSAARTPAVPAHCCLRLLRPAPPPSPASLPSRPAAHNSPPPPGSPRPSRHRKTAPPRWLRMRGRPVGWFSVSLRRVRPHRRRLRRPLGGCSLRPPSSARRSRRADSWLICITRVMTYTTTNS